MSELGFVVLAVMIATYVLLDGYDLGAAAIAPFVARTPEQRQAAMQAIGPYWNGNEVWLIAAGGVLFALFPRAYASAFSGFYLPFIIVLWLLMFRGMAMELRNHFSGPLWHGFWDAAFSWSSCLLILLLGVSIGNLVRGLPLDAHGYFVGTFALLLNPYALAVGAFAVVALAQHGLAYLVWRDGKGCVDAAEPAAARLWWATLISYVAITVATFAQRPAIAQRWWLVILVPLVSLPALFWLRRSARRGHSGRAFAASSVFLAAMLGAAAGTIYPYLLPAFPAGRLGLTIYDTSPGPVAQIVGLSTTILGLAAVVVYSAMAARRLGKSQG